MMLAARLFALLIRLSPRWRRGRGRCQDSLEISHRLIAAWWIAIADSYHMPNCDTCHFGKVWQVLSLSFLLDYVTSVLNTQSIGVAANV